MKKFLLVVMGIFVATVSFARLHIKVDYLTVKTIMDSTLDSIKSIDTVYTKSVLIGKSEHFSIFMKAKGDTAHLNIIACYSPSDSIPASNDSVLYRPSGTLPLWAETESDGTQDVLNADFTSTSWTVESEQPKLAVWLRYKIIGLATNGKNTRLHMIAITQKKREI